MFDDKNRWKITIKTLIIGNVLVLWFVRLIATVTCLTKQRLSIFEYFVN
jgi:hypothetical protein